MAAHQYSKLAASQTREMFVTLLPRDAMLARYMLWLCVLRPSVHLSQVESCIKTTKHIRSRQQRLARGFKFSIAKDLGDIVMRPRVCLVEDQCSTYLQQ